MGRLFHFGIAISLFFIATMMTSYIDSTSKIMECTACHDGIRSLHYNDVNYDFHFIVSLTGGLLPLLWIYMKRKYFYNSTIFHN